MGKTLATIALGLCISLCQMATGTTWYVDGSVSESGDGTSWETAFQKIQEGINAAPQGDTVIVREGTYYENITFHDKNIILRSTDPFDPDIVAKTIIDGNHAGAVVTFSGPEDETCVLSGFTIRNGRADRGGGICGGNEENPTHATIQNNVITGNSAHGEDDAYGGGLAFCDGTIQKNTVAGNSAYHGGGFYACDGTIQSNTITGNSARRGGGFYACDGTIENNVISGNTAEWYGGGAAFCVATIRNNIIARNSAGSYGGGLYGCDDTIENNTVHGNSAGKQGGGLYLCGGIIHNCIIWENRAPEGPNIFPESADSTLLTYSCIQNWEGAGVGNISTHPYLVDPEAGDYHLQTWSHCIDSGDPSSDFSNEPQPNGERVNMGAYGNTPEATSASADTDDDLLPDDWEMRFFGNLGQEASDDPDGDRIPNLQEYRQGTDPTSFERWYVDKSAPVPGDGTSWETAFKTIQDGINAASEGAIVSVAEGIYVANIHFHGKNITLTSKDPLDPTVVANTIIDGSQSGAAVTFLGAENEICVLAGFTICNGSATNGGGICGNGTHATIQKNIITANRADANGAGLHNCDGAIQNNIISGNSANYGGGMYSCHGAIQNNTISDNSARYGGGLARCDASIQHNTITGNSADMYGGGLARCHGAVQNNAITGNSAGMYGGGLYRCDGTIEGNTIFANWADYRGGGLDDCLGTVQNNTITGNWATWHGGGLYACDGTIQNNTIIANSAGYCGGGLDYCAGAIHNCIIWANRATYGAQLYDSSVPTHSCILDWTGEGEGNIAEQPRFVDPNNGDFRLFPSSPCIDAGDNNVSDLPETDIAGMHRIMYGGNSLTVDMGAYEYYINEMARGPGTEDMTFTWSSLADKSYSVFYSDDLVTWRLADDKVHSDGFETTSWIDDGSGTGVPPSLAPRRFYRVLENR